MEIVASLQEEIAAKETKIVKLKGLTTKSLRSDKRREQQIEALQIDLDDKDKVIDSLNEDIRQMNTFIERRTAKISELESEIELARNRIEKGLGSIDAQRYNDSLKDQLNKSNEKYSELMSAYQSLLEERQRSIPKASAPITTVYSVSPIEGVALHENSTYSIVDPSDFKPPILNVLKLRSPADDVAAKKDYLKRIFLEFLLGDQSIQSALAPIILKILE